MNTLIDDESQKRSENNEIIDHIEAVRAIVGRKCARCGGGMAGCMGCLFDSLDRGMIPASLDCMLNLMGNIPNDRKEAIAEGRRRHGDREAKWRKIFANGFRESVPGLSSAMRCGTGRAKAGRQAPLPPRQRSRSAATSSL